ncbi:MAG: hypothetical protein K2W96_05000 [Gemmataceae bacterium]|nr:hypothetical protein [Gemmataceae bacterium]
MATVPAPAAMKTLLWAALAGAALLPAGCVGLPGTWSKPPAPCQLAALWQNAVMHAPDTMRNGATNPGLAGRLLLFGPELGHPLVADGRLVVEMYDPAQPGAEPLERWDIHPNDLAKLGKKDRFGWGYTVFLPSARLTPAMTRVRLKTAYHPKGGSPIFTENDLTLAEGNGVIQQGTAPLAMKK